MTFPSNEARLQGVIVPPDASISDAMAHLEKAGTGALAVCSGDRKLIGIITGGDVRRGLLKSHRLTDACSSICNTEPVIAIHPIDSATALRLMNYHDIDHLPVIDPERTLRAFVLRADLQVPAQPSLAEDRIETVLISPNASIGDAVARLDAAGTGALLLTRGGHVLVGLLTDGDVRRAILQGKSMRAACETVASLKPVIARATISPGEALQLMNQHDIHHLPVVDSENRVMEFLLRKDLTADSGQSFSAVIMAGGYGKRLLPLTKAMPKPMLPVGDRPLLELTIQQLRRSGIREINLTTHYLPESIINHFGDGGAFGVRLNYLKEDHPMGTAGGLRQMKRPDGPLLVINGDVLTGAPFHEMFSFHHTHHAVITVGVRRYELQVPYGVVECDDVCVTSIQEKPSIGLFINAGTYLLEPSAWDLIPEGRPFDMTDLIQELLRTGAKVVSFPILEYWLDIGKHEDYNQAQADARNGKFPSTRPGLSDEAARNERPH